MSHHVYFTYQVLLVYTTINEILLGLNIFFLFRELGWQGLIDEVEMEVQRISARNLGRDDR